MTDKYNIPYENFQAGDDIEPTQFNSNFAYIESALNELFLDEPSFSGTLSANGGYDIPGLQIRWGTAMAGVQGTFATPFTTSCLFVLTNIQDNSASTHNNNDQYVSSKNTTGFTTTTTTYNRQYIAIGH
jgi:hypothetical protein